jgi:hypothetical protein
VITSSTVPVLPMLEIRWLLSLKLKYLTFCFRETGSYGGACGVERGD